MVRANNAMRLREIQRTIIEDNDVFENIHTVNISTIDRVLHRNQMSMKQLYRVPFQRNEDRVKELRYQYVQRIMELESSEPSHNFVYVDEAGFNLTKCRRRGRNIIGHRATVDLPGQRGGNITMCAAISEHGVLTHIPLIGPYNTQHLLNLLETLYRALIPDDERGLFREDLPKSSRSVSAHRHISSISAPPTFSSPTRHPWPFDSTGFPRPTGSPLVSRYTTSATDLQMFRYATFLHSYGCTSSLAPPQTIVTVASPRPPVPAMPLVFIGSPFAPWDPSALPPSVIPQLTLAFTPPCLPLPRLHCGLSSLGSGSVPLDILHLAARFSSSVLHHALIIFCLHCVITSAISKAPSIPSSPLLQ
ncbi:unnamed protein product [Leuciscus chuanchicus]